MGDGPVNYALSASARTYYKDYVACGCSRTCLQGFPDLRRIQLHEAYLVGQHDRNPVVIKGVSGIQILDLFSEESPCFLFCPKRTHIFHQIMIARTWTYPRLKMDTRSLSN